MPYIDSPLPEFQGQGYQEDPQHKNYRTEQKGLQIKTVNGIITSSRDVVDLLPLNNFLGRPHLSMHCAITILHSFMGV